MAENTSQYGIELLLGGLTIKQFIELIPGHFFIKNKDGVYLESNMSVREIGQLEIEGKTDCEMPWKNESDQLRKNDVKVMESRRQLVFVEKIHAKDKEEVTFYTIKAPLYDREGNVVGVVGHATLIEK